MKKLIVFAVIFAIALANGNSLVADFYWQPNEPTDLQEVQFYDNSTGEVVAWIWYFGDGESSTERNPAHLYKDDGTYTVRLVVWDKNGNMAYNEKIINVLNVPPVAIAGENIISNATVITFNASNSYDLDGCIVNYTWDFGDGSTGYGIVVEHSYNSSGIYNVTLTVIDDDEASDSDEIQVLFDNNPPETNYSIEEIKEWYNKSVEIFLNATDNLAGIYKTFYRIGNDSWKEYNESINISSEGINILRFYSVDNAGNYEQEKNLTIKIDLHPPSTNYSINATYGNEGWIRSTPIISLSASDVLSGVNKTLYKINDGEWEEYKGEINISADGEHIIRFYSIDNAGNREQEKNITLKIDTRAPTMSIVAPEEGYIYIASRKIIPTLFDNTYIIGRFAVEVEANDTRSGMYCIEFLLNNQTLWKDYVSPYSVELPREFPCSFNKLKVVAYDFAGNKAESKEITYLKIL
ncbi:MAG: PKD domain-containing protein [Thermoplasmatales archaeon]|nr:PKD domain-containing protein [Thermoplasmatales archaeon]